MPTNIVTFLIVTVALIFQVAKSGKRLEAKKTCRITDLFDISASDSDFDMESTKAKEKARFVQWLGKNDRICCLSLVEITEITLKLVHHWNALKNQLPWKNFAEVANFEICQKTASNISAIFCMYWLCQDGLANIETKCVLLDESTDINSLYSIDLLVLQERPTFYEVMGCFVH